MPLACLLRGTKFCRLTFKAGVALSAAPLILGPQIKLDER